MHQESWDPLTAILQPSLIFKFNYGTALRELWRPLLLAPPLIALIGHQQQPWQLMQLDIATLPVLETLAIDAT
jgi:hypothetical protein